MRLIGGATASKDEIVFVGAVAVCAITSAAAGCRHRIVSRPVGVRGGHNPPLGVWSSMEPASTIS
jgi:hypothetical protein